MKSVLVTGAGGYIGSNTVKLLLEAGYRTVCLDNFSCGFRKPLELLQEKYGKDKLAIYTDDLTVDGGAAVMDQEKDIVGVLHFAALLNVGESMQIPEQYFTNNVIGTQKLLHAMIDRHIGYFIFSSSCTVYGQIDNPPVDESLPVKGASSAYGATKQLCEQILEWYDQLGKIKYLSLRYFNVCGASDDSMLGDAKRETFGLMQNAVKGALGIRPFDFNYQKVDTPDGSPVRDFINVVDLADAHVRGLEYLMQTNQSDIFNLGTGHGNSVLEIVNEIKRVLGAEFPTLDAPHRRTGEIPKIYADYSKAKKLLGWEPKRTLEQSIKTLAQFYKDHPSGWA